MFADYSFDVKCCQIDTLPHLRNAGTMLGTTGQVVQGVSPPWCPLAQPGIGATRAYARDASACPTNGMTRPTSASAPMLTLPFWHKKTSCVFWMRLNCKTLNRAFCPIWAAWQVFHFQRDAA